MKNGFFISSGDISLDYAVLDRRSENLESDHCHDGFEIVYYSDAFGSCIVEGVDHPIFPGSIMLISPFSYHRVELDCENKTRLYSLSFSKAVLPGGPCKMLEAIIGEGDSNGKFYSSDKIGPALSGCFDRFELALGLPEAQKRAYLEALLSEIILLLSVVEGESIVHHGDSLGARAMRYLNNNIEKNISLDHLARHFFVSKYHLCRAFKEHSGISVHSYINHKRIMYARRLIESGITASGAAEKVGFGDYSAFYRAYVKIVGKSPTAN